MALLNIRLTRSSCLFFLYGRDLIVRAWFNHARTPYNCVSLNKNKKGGDGWETVPALFVLYRISGGLLSAVCRRLITSNVASYRLDGSRSLC
jgi:hypothetical protein